MSNLCLDELIRNLGECRIQRVQRAYTKPMTKKGKACWTLAFVAAMAWVSEVAAAEKFRKLSGTQIAARFPGMELTDDVHWRDVYERNGTPRAYGMGRKGIGKWRVEKGQLCVDRGKQLDGGCYDVWSDGDKVELRQDSTMQFEGTLQKASDGR